MSSSFTSIAKLRTVAHTFFTVLYLFTSYMFGIRSSCTLLLKSPKSKLILQIHFTDVTNHPGPEINKNSAFSMPHWPHDRVRFLGTHLSTCGVDVNTVCTVLSLGWWLVHYYQTLHIFKSQTGFRKVVNLNQNFELSQTSDSSITDWWTKCK